LAVSIKCGPHYKPKAIDISTAKKILNNNDKKAKIYPKTW
jgi:hypothetical protein